MSVLAEIQNCYDSLSRTQKQIADYILEHTGSVCFQTLKQLSQETGTSEATILSFCAKLGCENFIGLKQDLQQYMQRWVSPNEKMRVSVSQLGPNEKSLQRIMDLDSQCLQWTFEHLSAEELHRFVDEIKKANRINIVGHGASSPVAMFLTMRLQQVGMRPNSINILDHRAVVYEAAGAGPDDLFIIIAFPDYAPQTVALAAYLAKAGANIVSITDSASSPVARSAKAVLLCSTDNIIFFNSLTAPMALVNIVMSLLVLESRESFAGQVEKLDGVERFLRSAQEAYVGSIDPSGGHPPDRI